MLHENVHRTKVLHQVIPKKLHRCMNFAFWNASSCTKTKDFALTFAKILKFGVKLCINFAQGYAFAQDNGFVSSFAQNYAHGGFVPSKKCMELRTSYEAVAESFWLGRQNFGTNPPQDLSLTQLYPQMLFKVLHKPQPLHK